MTSTMHPLAGSCHCGNITVTVGLTRPPHEYIPRACDCEFCCKHGAAYISDPAGSLVIKLADKQLLQKYRQGSATADMLICAGCGVLIGGCYQADGQLFAAINSRIIDGNSIFAASQPVSPKTLSADQKVQRWTQLWFRNVRLITA